jgi:hypothetical protein
MVVDGRHRHHPGGPDRGSLSACLARRYPRLIYLLAPPGHPAASGGRRDCARCGRCRRCRGVRKITRLKTGEFFPVQLIGCASGQLRTFAMTRGVMPRHLAVRGARMAMFRRSCRAGIGGHGWHRRRRGWRRHGRRRHGGPCRTCCVRRQARPAGVRTRHTHWVSARWTGRLCRRGRTERERGNDRDSCHEMFHSLILFVGWGDSTCRLLRTGYLDFFRSRRRDEQTLL